MGRYSTHRATSSAVERRWQCFHGDVVVDVAPWVPAGSGDVCADRAGGAGGLGGGVAVAAREVAWAPPDGGPEHLPRLAAAEAGDLGGDRAVGGGPPAHRPFASAGRPRVRFARRGCCCGCCFFVVGFVG